MSWAVAFVDIRKDGIAETRLLIGQSQNSTTTELHRVFDRKANILLGLKATFLQHSVYTKLQNNFWNARRWASNIVNPYSAGIDFSRQNLTSVDVKFDD